MARSRSGGEDPKQVLIVTLVLFILLSLLLGVIAYFGYAEQGELRTKLAQVTRQKDRANDERRAYLVSMVALKQMIGANFANKEEVGDFEGERNVTKWKDKDGKDLGLAFEYVTKPHKEIIWDPNQKLPTKTYLEMIREMKDKKERAEKAQKLLEEQVTKNQVKYTQDVLALKKQNDDMKKVLEDTTNKLVEKFNELDKRYNDEMKKLVAAMPDFAVQEKKIKELEAERDKTRGQLAATLAEMKKQREKLESKIVPVDFLAYDQPKGKITNLDREGKTAYLNLGSDDAARPGLTFSVWTPGSYKAETPEKGMVKIVQVLDRHLSIAKVTEVRQAARDPLMKGDELRNPLWTPGLREHVAIAGFIDLLGDGRDATPELVRMLEKQGVVVDIWLDLRDMKWKGANKDREEKITTQTTYFIRGAKPELDVAMPKEGDRRVEGQLNINALMADLEVKAKERSVTIVDARRFLALMGLKAPVPPKDTDWAPYLLRRPREEAADMPAKKDGKEMPKKEEEKKE